MYVCTQDLKTRASLNDRAQRAAAKKAELEAQQRLDDQAKADKQVSWLPSVHDSFTHSFIRSRSDSFMHSLTHSLTDCTIATAGTEETRTRGQS